MRLRKKKVVGPGAGEGVAAHEGELWRVVAHSGRPKDRKRVVFETHDENEAHEAYARRAGRTPGHSPASVRLVRGNEWIRSYGVCNADNPIPDPGNARRERLKREQRRAERAEAMRARLEREHGERMAAMRRAELAASRARSGPRPNETHAEWRARLQRLEETAKRAADKFAAAEAALAEVRRAHAKRDR